MRSNQSRRYLQIILVLFMFYILFSTRWVFAEDPGKQDSLFIQALNCSFIIGGFHDEPLSGFAVPFKYKTHGTDISLDSVHFSPVIEGADIKDSVIDRENGTVTVFAIWFDSLPPGTDTFFTLYFTPGPNWSPSGAKILDTFRLESSQGLSFTDVSVNDIMPHFTAPTGFGKGCLEVWEKIKKTESQVPANFFLSQNLPNPFNSETVIAFGLPQTSQVRLEVFNILGQSVKTLVNGQLPAGYHNVTWDGKNARGKKVVSGIYFYKLKTESFKDVKKMSFIK